MKTEDNKYSIQKFVDHYDKLVADWLSDRTGTLKSQKYFTSLYEKNKNKDKDNNDIFLSNGIPEPYFGNPNECTALVININPGEVIGANDYDKRGTKGNIINEKGKYSDMAKGFPYLTMEETKENTRALDFWKRRKEWIDNFTGEKVNLFALELCPWHSSHWYAPKWTRELKDEVNELVLQPACEIIKSRGLKYGFIIGKAVCETIRKIGKVGKEEKWKYVLKCEVTQDNKDSVVVAESPISSSKICNETRLAWKRELEEVWPKDNDGYSLRSYSLLSDGETYFFCTWAPGSNTAPAVKGFRKSKEKNTVENLVSRYIEQYISM